MIPTVLRGRFYKIFVSPMLRCYGGKVSPTLQFSGFAGQSSYAPEHFLELLQGVVKRVLGKDSAWQVLIDLSPLIRLIITQPLP